MSTAAISVLFLRQIFLTTEYLYFLLLYICVSYASTHCVADSKGRKTVLQEENSAVTCFVL